MKTDRTPMRFVAEGLSKDYGPARVLNDVGLAVAPGEIHALLGANGAGKSTLCKIMAGLIAPTSGAMALDDQAYRPGNKQAAESQGVQIVQQELNLIPTLTVAENLLLNQLPHSCGVIRRGALHHRARQALDRLGLDEVRPEQIVGELGIGTQQMIEIAAALDRRCQLLILDEPTAALSARETGRLFDWLLRLSQQGVGLIYVSHRLDEIKRIANRATVLRDGQYVTTRDAASLSTQDMVELMTGEVSHAARARRHQSHCRKEVLLDVQGLDRQPTLREISLQVHRGERLGIAGLVGSGRTELLRAIFGADRGHQGSIELAGNPKVRRFSSPRQAVRAGMAMVTEDRKATGLLLSQSIRSNTTLGSLSRLRTWLGTLPRSREVRVAERQRAEMETRCQSVEQSVETLSGGNQQKVVISKWLETDAELFLFDEPTRGIDVAARERIYRLFESLAAQGKGLLIVSSDLEELMENCDSIAVMSAGRLTGPYRRDSWTREELMRAAFSGYMDEQ